MKLRPFHLGSLSLACLLGCAPQSTVNSITTSDTPSPVSTPTATTTAMEMAQNQQVLSAGNLVNGEHPTSGRVQIVQQGKQRILELGANFKTSDMGPDLVVILHRSTDVIGSTVPPAYPIKEGDYVLLAPLKSFSGVQSYPIPAEINLADYPSAAIWCRKFNATFGAARLS
ncbi:MAG: DM13 domain-containing protein [Aphanocapsa sp. GSE-SYN-MK-11-07L]|nr:DM13 domain-containing protein [Aphanocapsa sp. GSE-SYN-MK-11-07L]